MCTVYPQRRNPLHVHPSRDPRHEGKFEHPQNSRWRGVPLYAILISIGALHFGQSGGICIPPQEWNTTGKYTKLFYHKGFSYSISYQGYWCQILLYRTDYTTKLWIFQTNAKKRPRQPKRLPGASLLQVFVAGDDAAFEVNFGAIISDDDLFRQLLHDHAVICVHDCSALDVFREAIQPHLDLTVSVFCGLQFCLLRFQLLHVRHTILVLREMEKNGDVVVLK